MSSHLHKLINEKANDVIVAEGFARELAEIAYTMQQDGHSVAAQGMLDLGRYHRVRGIKIRAEIAALSRTAESDIDEDR